ncbi:MAG: hypothetical protein WBD07_03380 [Vicinamibacterales bacterium]
MVPESLERRIRKVAQRNRLSTGAWVRQALERALHEGPGADPLDQLARLGGPTGDIDQMLAEIEAGRG